MLTISKKTCNRCKRDDNGFIPGHGTCVVCEEQAERPAQVAGVKRTHAPQRDYRYLRLIPIYRAGVPTAIIGRGCEMWGLSPQEILRDRRQAHYVLCRQWIVFALMQICGWTVVRCADFMHKDHSTIIYGQERLRRDFARTPGMQEKYEAEVKRLYGELSHD